METQTVQTVPSSDVTDTKVGANSDVTNKYDVIVKVDKYSNCVRSAPRSGCKDVYSSPVYIPQWSSWVRGLMGVYGDGRVAICLYHHTDRDVDFRHFSPQHQQLSLQTSVTSSTTLEVMHVVEEKTRGSHLAENGGRYLVGGQWYYPAQKGWVVEDDLTVKLSLTL